MLRSILGSGEAEKALAFIAARDKGYAYEIAKFFDTNLRGIQKQLERLENGGVLASKKVGRTRVYSFNPRYPLAEKLKDLIIDAIKFYPEDMQTRLFVRRERPRRTGKPL